MFKSLVAVAAALSAVIAVSGGVASAADVDDGIAEREMFGVAAGAGSEPGAQPTPCELAIGGPCEPSLQAAYDRWQTNLPALLAADLGDFSPELSLYDETQTVMSALTACMNIATATDPIDGEWAWVAMQGDLHPSLLLSESFELFDASMAVLCPDLDYRRGYDWQGTAESTGEGGTNNTVKDGLAELPGWQFVDCADALADFCGDAGMAEAFDQWGFKLAMMYADPETGYTGPSLGWFEDGGVTDYAEFDRLVLRACNAASHGESAGTSDAEDQWYQETTAAYPDAPANDIRALFYASLYLVCPAIAYIPAG